MKVDKIASKPAEFVPRAPLLSRPPSQPTVWTLLEVRTMIAPLPYFLWSLSFESSGLPSDNKIKRHSFSEASRSQHITVYKKESDPPPPNERTEAPLARSQYVSFLERSWPPLPPMRKLTTARISKQVPPPLPFFAWSHKPPDANIN